MTAEVPCRLEVSMSRPTVILGLLSVFVCNAASQSIPQELLSTPTRLELDKPTQEAKAGSTVTYTVTLKDSRDRAVPTSKDLQLVVETPAGKQTVVLPAGQSSAKFTWQALKSGVTQMTVQSGALHPATGLILVAPPPTTKLIGMKNSSAAGEVARVKPMPQKERGPKPGAAIGAPVGVMAKKAGRAPASEQPVGTAATPVSGPSPTQAVPLEQAKKLKLYITPLPVYGNAIGHIWQASVSVAALNEQDSLVPVAADVSVHFNARLGKISPADIILSAGQLSNFQNPVLLTDDHVGKGSVDVVSSLGPAGPIEVDYLLPPPTQLRIALGSPVLSGTGSSSVTVQICVLDESGGVTSSSEDLEVTLTPSIGQLKSSLATIHHGSSCSDPIEWNSASGPASVLAESSGLKSENKSMTFPSFPWYLVWLAAVGGLVGALVRSWGNLFSARGLSHAWRSLALGALLGFIFYLFTRFGAIVLPENFPVMLQNIPVLSGAGSFAIGFVGGVLGRKFWKVD